MAPKRAKRAAEFKQYGSEVGHHGPRVKRCAVSSTTFGPAAAPANTNRCPLITQRAPVRDHLPAVQQQHDDFWQSSEYDSHTTHKPQRPSASRHQQDRQRQQVHWQEQTPDLVRRQLCQLAGEANRQQRLKEVLLSNFNANIAAAVSTCPFCDAVSCLQPICPAVFITYATIQGQLEVSLPQYRCVSCQHTLTVHPVDVGCFPATPLRAEVWYDRQLLSLTSACQMSGPSAIQAHCSALQQLHMQNGFGPGKPAVWNNLATATQEWRRIQVQRIHQMACSRSKQLGDFQICNTCVAS